MSSNFRTSYSWKRKVLLGRTDLTKLNGPIDSDLRWFVHRGSYIAVRQLLRSLRKKRTTTDLLSHLQCFTQMSVIAIFVLISLSIYQCLFSARRTKWDKTTISRRNETKSSNFVSFQSIKEDMEESFFWNATTKDFTIPQAWVRFASTSEVMWRDGNYLMILVRMFRHATNSFFTFWQHFWLWNRLKTDFLPNIPKLSSSLLS